MLVNNDFRLFASGPKTIADEIDFGFYYRKIVLRSALQNETCTKRRKIGNAGDIKKDIFGEHCGKPGENSLRLPTLALKIHNVGLHENGAAITKNGHGLRGESQIRVLI